MVLALAQTATAVCPRCPASFQGAGGTAPYTYYVLSGGAGGTIDLNTGVYTGPLYFKSSPFFNTDIIAVDDATGATAKAHILVGSPLLLLCEIIQKELLLESDRVYLWDQKIMQPTDFGLYVAVSMS